MTSLVVIKAGTTFPNTARQYGDFEDWTSHGLGLAMDQISVIDAVCERSLPSPQACDGVVVTGSHSMVTDGHDWIERLIEWIAGLVDARVPFFGICFGHQLLAAAAGGEVGYHPKGKEIGTVDIDVLAQGATDRLFQDLPTRFPAHVTHAQTVLSLPQSAIRLAENAFEHCHGIRVGECAWGVQFHPEYDANIMRSYVEEQTDVLEAAGTNSTEICRSIRATNEAATLLRRFVKICQQDDQTTGKPEACSRGT